MVKLPKWMFYVLISIITFDLGISFFQHYSMNLDGDLARIVVPEPSYIKILNNPFGFVLFKDHRCYSATNRFFAHWQMYHYFRIMPHFLQNFVNSIQSLYLASAIAKTVFQIIFLYALAVSIAGTARISSRSFIFAAFIIMPLFQTYCQNASMGLIHDSITYAFFYSFPLAIQLLLFLPFVLQYYRQHSFEVSGYYLLFTIPVCVYLSLSGPLSAPIFIVVGSLVLLKVLIDAFRKNKYCVNNQLFSVLFKELVLSKNIIWFVYIIIGFYSLYLGIFNSEAINDYIPLIERYKILPKGIFVEFFLNSGMFILTICCFINAFIMLKINIFSQYPKILKLTIFLLCFGVLYTLLLPLGGYRAYRPLIVRSDSYMPVITVCVFFYGFSSLLLVNNLIRKYKISYLVFLGSISFFYFYQDGIVQTKNKSEKQSLEIIEKTHQSQIVFNHNNTVLSWEPIYSFDKSIVNAELIRIVGIKNTIIPYCNNEKFKKVIEK